jgi:hypothetical protein
VNVMNNSDLVSLVRIAIAASSVLTALVAFRALRGKTPEEHADAAPFLRLALGWGVGVGVIAALLSHTRLVQVGVQVLPLGMFGGVGLAVASLFFAPARRAFDRLSDADTRALSACRTLFGAFLFAGAALGLFPPSFALLAGTGDLVAGWLASTMPSRLGAGGSRAARLVVHGIGAVDFVDVLAVAIFVVRPWLIETGSSARSSRRRRATRSRARDGS